MFQSKLRSILCVEGMDEVTPFLSQPINCALVERQTTDVSHLTATGLYLGLALCSSLSAHCIFAALWLPG